MIEIPEIPEVTEVCARCMYLRDAAIHTNNTHYKYHQFTLLPTKPVNAPIEAINVRSRVLLEAARLINGDRQEDYGTPQESFASIARLWSEYLGVSIKPSQVAMCMGLLKVARQMQGPKKQNTYVDAAGYYALAAELAMEEE